MEIPSEKASSKAPVKNEKMSLEKYLDFLSHKELDLTVRFLNEIISMHGFKKILKVPKKVLTDAVNTLDLVDPSRSTLKDNVSSLAFVTLEEIIADLKDLNWQECSVTSVQTLNSQKPSLQSTSHCSKPKEDSRLVRKRKRCKSKVVKGGGGEARDRGESLSCVSLGSRGSS